MRKKEKLLATKKTSILTLAVFLGQILLPALPTPAFAQMGGMGGMPMGGAGGGAGAAVGLVTTGINTAMAPGVQDAAGGSGTKEEDSCDGPDNQDNIAKQHCALKKTSEVAAIGQGAAALSFTTAGVMGAMACSAQPNDQNKSKTLQAQSANLVRGSAELKAAFGASNTTADATNLANTTLDGAAKDLTTSNAAENGPVATGAVAKLDADFSQLTTLMANVGHCALVGAPATSAFSDLKTAEASVLANSALVNTAVVAATTSETASFGPVAKLLPEQNTMDGPTAAATAAMDSSAKDSAAGVVAKAPSESLYGSAATSYGTAATQLSTSGGIAKTYAADTATSVGLVKSTTTAADGLAKPMGTLTDSMGTLTASIGPFHSAWDAPSASQAAACADPQYAGATGNADCCTAIVPAQTLVTKITTEITLANTANTKMAAAVTAYTGAEKSLDTAMAASAKAAANLNVVQMKLAEPKVLVPLDASGAEILADGAAKGAPPKEAASATSALQSGGMAGAENLAKNEAKDGVETTGAAAQGADTTGVMATYGEALNQASVTRPVREATHDRYVWAERIAYGVDIAGSVATTAAGIAFGQKINASQLVTSLGVPAAGLITKATIGGGASDGGQPTLNCPWEFILDFGQAGLRGLTMAMSIKTMGDAATFQHQLQGGPTITAAINPTQAPASGMNDAGGGGKTNQTPADPQLLASIPKADRPRLTAQNIASTAATSGNKLPEVLQSAGTTPEALANSLLDGKTPMEAAQPLVDSYAPSQSGILSSLSNNRDKFMEIAKEELSKIPSKQPEVSYASSSPRSSRRPAGDDMDMSNLLAALMPKKTEGAPGAKAVDYGKSSSGKITADGLHPADRSLFEIIDSRYALVSTRFLDGNLQLSSAPPPAQTMGAGTGAAGSEMGMPAPGSAAPRAPATIVLPKNPYLRK